MAKIKQLEWATVKSKIRDLVPLNYNPRKISELNSIKLKSLLEEFGVVEIPVTNFDGTLLTWHQRAKIMVALGRGDEIIDVRKPNRMLSEAEIKKYNLASNTHQGEWDIELLESNFGNIDMDFFDIKIPEIEDLGTSYEDDSSEIYAEKKPKEKPTNMIAVSLNDEEYECWCNFKEKIGFGSDKKVIFEAIKIISNEKTIN